MVLKAENITREFFRNGKGTNLFTAVEPTSFTLEEGSFTEIIGKSGSGKTTFINMLCGLLSPTAGKVTIDGADFYAMSDDERSVLRNRHIGIIPQGQTGLQSLTVMENILAPAAMYGDAEPVKERAIELMEQMEIADLAEVYSNELSGGELRRMSIARALVNSPEIIIADEPTADIDEETSEKVLQMFRGLADAGASVLMVTHEKEAEKYADRIYKMSKGVLTEI